MEVVKEEELVEWKLFATFAEDFAHKEYCSNKNNTRWVSLKHSLRNLTNVYVRLYH